MRGKVELSPGLPISIELCQKLRRREPKSERQRGERRAKTEESREDSRAGFSNEESREDSGAGFSAEDVLPALDALSVTPFEDPLPTLRSPLPTSHLPAASSHRPPPASQSPPDSQPPYYWTWRLLASGFSLDECMAIRSLRRADILDHALRAAESGLAVRPEWCLGPALLSALEGVVGETAPQQIRPLLAQLPPGTRYEEVQLFLKCR
jgi:hypothetical protein